MPRPAARPSPRPAGAGGLAASLVAVSVATHLSAQSGSPPERFAMRVVTQGLDGGSMASGKSRGGLTIACG
jgi:hypothetical protein